jgi:glycosyltransferase involved in cell wall biosynthesis
MKVGIDISQTVYEGTGSARYVINLLRGFAELGAESGLELTLFGSAYKRRKFLDRYAYLGKQARFYPFPPKFFELLWNKLHVVNFEEFAGKVDIYHASDWTQGPSKAKKVTTVHDLIPFLFPEFVHPRIRAAHQARWKWIQKEADVVIVDAECTKQDILGLFELSEERIAVIPLGIEKRFLDLGAYRFNGDSSRAQFLEVAQVVLEKYKLGAGKYILSVGTLEPRKNMRRLVEAYACLDSEIRNEYPLVIVGKPSWMDQIAVPEGCDVRFTGFIDDDDLPYMYVGAKLFVMPSLYEGFGFPVLEAMACGTPVLAAQVASLPEVGGDCVEYFVDALNSDQMIIDLRRCLENYSVQKLIGAHMRASEMTWNVVARKTLQLYKKMYNER